MPDKYPTPRADIRGHLTPEFLRCMELLFPPPRLEPERAKDSAVFWYEAGKANVVERLKAIAQESFDE